MYETVLAVGFIIFCLIMLWSAFKTTKIIMAIEYRDQWSKSFREAAPYIIAFLLSFGNAWYLVGMLPFPLLLK